MRTPKIVVIGGGTGLPVILNSLSRYDAEITAIVTVADDGGSSGDLRQAMNIAPPGDLRNVLISMSDLPAFYGKLFQYRFKTSDSYLANHPLGNLIIAAVAEMQDSTYNAIQLLSHMMHARGKIYPSSESALTLHAVFQDGVEIAGESKIAGYAGKIDHVFVTNTYDNQTPKAARKVVQSILDADLIVMGPGSLFTSVLPNLVIAQIKEAMLQTDAERVYICNIMTQRGETEHFTDAEHVQMLNKHLGGKIVDTVLVNIEPVPQDYMDNNQFDEYLVQVRHDFNGLREAGSRVISANLLKLENGGAFHDGEKVTAELMKLV
ncbi:MULTISPECIES: YvcK family protein [unclassified Enterococcus]|uniref:gluconeogenesis factor YvcK family protein n=1 Tax=unclassified Enterococcus TaxID=2608891 RepID=UPI0015526D0C|nr:MULTISPECIES: YvcK family protein [unclassified Enterococcus]MBS7576239.1 YvcK family protein [Enterococcus sp. MMGLQ5-2]MBS7583472.1 YvcK family protein [Enterococcus sp. MMGLQ5-1]NPD11332.1 YvcK family protein [Enterococcus sp. MMGLQ5-1]NPD36075.1 YvcK family protein [Enterococcus sp. MMGLQ5-2]